MARAKYAATATLIVSLVAAGMAAGASAGQIQPPIRASLRMASCYGQPHTRAHETLNLSAALAEARHSLWLVTQPQCGPVPLMQSVRRWSRLLIHPSQ